MSRILSHQREVFFVEPSVNDLVSGLADGIGNLGIESKLFVDLGRGLLEDTEGLDDGKWHPLGSLGTGMTLLDD